jgi:hypothetical protein
MQQRWLSKGKLQAARIIHPQDLLQSSTVEQQTSPPPLQKVSLVRLSLPDLTIISVPVPAMLPVWCGPVDL